MTFNLIHTADWHLGQTFFGYDRDNEHDAFLSWLISTIESRQTDVLLISGDVFDVANPSAIAQRRFFRFLKEANRLNPGLQIVITAGNHDSAARLEAPSPLLEELGTSVVGVIRRKEDGTIDFDSLIIPLYNRKRERRALCLAVPYLRQGDYPEPEDGEDTYVAGINRMYKQLYAYAESKRMPGETIVAMGHLHATGAEVSDDDRSERVIMGGLESVSVDAFDTGLAYTALGHIHKAQRVGGRETVRYAGSPLPMSFSEVNYRHQVVSVIIEDGQVLSVETLPVPVTTELLKIPLSAASPDVVLAMLTELPDIEDRDISTCPFLEVRVLFTEPDPGFRHRVEEVLDKKAVRLTSIVPSYPGKGDENDFQALSYNDLQKIDPVDMLKHAFTAKYGGDMPDEMEQLFNEVMREAAI